MRTVKHQPGCAELRRVRLRTVQWTNNKQPISRVRNRASTCPCIPIISSRGFVVFIPRRPLSPSLGNHVMETRTQQLYRRRVRVRSSRPIHWPSASPDGSLPLHHGPTAPANIHLHPEYETLNSIVVIQECSDDLLIHWTR